MNPTAPSRPVFIIALVLGILSVISVYIEPLPVIAGHGYVFMLVAWALLAVGCLFRGL